MRLPISTKQSYWLVLSYLTGKKVVQVAQLLSHHVASHVTKEWMIRSLSIGGGACSP